MNTNILDVAWQEINALGGAPCCSHDHVWNAAIRDALMVIERLGGRDPLLRNGDRKDTGLRFGDGLKPGAPPRLMEDDGPVVDELPGWTALKRAMNGGGERET